MELSAIAASVIGGASLAGGKADVKATLIGSLTIVVIQNGLNLHAVSASLQNVITGFIIIFAVLLDMWRDELGNLFAKITSKSSGSAEV
jgi:ribose transport system permease protein